MRCKSLFVAVIALPLLAAGAQAGVWGGHSNDTGGIIPYTPETAYTYREIAAAQCARWYKIAYITSVHRAYGDYIGYVCHFPRRYDPRKAGEWIWHF